MTVKDKIISYIHYLDSKLEDIPHNQLRTQGEYILDKRLRASKALAGHSIKFSFSSLTRFLAETDKIAAGLPGEQWMDHGRDLVRIKSKLLKALRYESSTTLKDVKVMLDGVYTVNVADLVLKIRVMDGGWLIGRGQGVSNWVFTDGAQTTTDPFTEIRNSKSTNPSHYGKNNIELALSVAGVDTDDCEVVIYHAPSAGSEKFDKVVETVTTDGWDWETFAANSPTLSNFPTHYIELYLRIK